MDKKRGSFSNKMASSLPLQVLLWVLAIFGDFPILLQNTEEVSSC